MRRLSGQALAQLPPDTRPARRFRVHPTPSGVFLAVLLALFVLVAPEVTDPSMAGFVWAGGLGALVIGAVWPCAVARVTSVSAAPAVAGDRASIVRVGERTDVTIVVGGRPSDVILRWVDAPVGDSVVVGAGVGSDVEVPLVPVRRGRFGRLALVVTCDAPFGLWSASRTVVVDLPRPMVVGPALLDANELPDLPIGSVGDIATTAIGHGGDTTRSVRPYVAGDPAHLVHWPTTARTGSIVVREMEPPADRAVAVVVDLGAEYDAGAGFGGSGGGGGSAAGPADRELPLMPTTALAPSEAAVERAVAKAATIVRVLHGAGVHVLLATADPTPQVAEVGGDDDTDARLSVASGGVPGAIPPGWPVLHVGVGESADG